MIKRFINRIRLYLCKVSDSCSAEYICELDSTNCHNNHGIPIIGHAHSYLHNNAAWYRAWHHHPNRSHVHWGVFALMILSFLVFSFSYVHTVQAQPNFVQVDSKKASGSGLQGTVDILDAQGGSLARGNLRAGLTFRGPRSDARKIQISFTDAPISSLELDNISISEEGIIDIPVDEIPASGHWNRKFALGDVTGLAFTKGRFKKAAEGKDLFKCALWDYTNQTCTGRWIKLANIVPGSEYTIEFTPADPGYAESSRRVNALNKKSELLDFEEQSSETETSVKLVPVATPVVENAPPLPVPAVNVINVSTESLNNDVIIEVVHREENNVTKKEIFIDTTALVAEEVKVTDVALSPKLLTCLEYNQTEGICRRWKKEKNLVVNEEYELVSSSPGQSVYGQAKDGFLVLDQRLEVIPSIQSILQNPFETIITVQLIDMNPHKIITYFDAETGEQLDEIIINTEENTETNPDRKTIEFQSETVAKSADIEATAVGNDLFECNDFDFGNQICKGKYIKKKDLVKNENYSFNIEKRNTASELFESKKQIALLDKENALLNYTETKVADDIEIVPTNPNIIKKIIVKNHTENTNNDLRVEENVLTDNPLAVQSFAIDPTGLGTNSEFEIEAKGNTLMKCKDWDFTTSTCLGTWEKARDLEPGSLYILPVDSADPGFMETNESTPPPSDPNPTPTPEPTPAPTPEPAPEPTLEPTPTPEPAPITTTSSGGGGGGSAIILPLSNSTTSTISTTSIFPVTSSLTTTTNTINNPLTLNTTTATFPYLAQSGTITTATLTNNSAVSTTPNKTVLTTINRGIGFGQVSQEVKEIQKFFNTIGIAVAKTGPGSPGKETKRYGYQTKEAVKKFQVKYDIAKPGDRGYGYIGPKTRAKIKELSKEF
ncbi:hypothetical protein A2645_01885 [Candidatus Nomurabacteria bacterium RIFCSPHIGHO2_01_FULL_39_9]|uniref:Peptidoglycan binding-like domain-containing protein n=1 Tax=Candidatus Nomurabacteria bacterium RIFCSPHIGHO2_01_FULL_39_9 TaxID=1801735 RepID=A0A1F6UWX7_9BACT|nr:MAG: hypothetical protein A2645_01885 [Candidatus Nomurabacteria bacterium RIFCSPHIGHO2_01_FULL_39_9]